MPDLNDMTADELREEAYRRGIDPGQIEGSGASGAALKSDLVEVLSSTQPPAITDTETLTDDGPDPPALEDVAVERGKRPARDRSAMFTTQTEE